MVVGEYSTQSIAVASACRGNCARSSERARIETRARPHANSAASFNQPNTHSGRKQTMPTNSCHPEAPHRKLRLPDVFVSSLMLDRAVDAILRRVHLDHDHDVPYLADTAKMERQYTLIVICPRRLATEERALPSIGILYCTRPLKRHRSMNFISTISMHTKSPHARRQR